MERNLFAKYDPTKVTATKVDRRSIMLATRSVSFACAIAFALISLDSNAASVVSLFAVVFAAGIARGFHDPASIAFEAQVVPQPRAAAVQRKGEHSTVPQLPSAGQMPEGAAQARAWVASAQMAPQVPSAPGLGGRPPGDNGDLAR